MAISSTIRGQSILQEVRAVRHELHGVRGIGLLQLPRLAREKYAVCTGTTYQETRYAASNTLKIQSDWSLIELSGS
jgi:hypothetical protein